MREAPPERRTRGHRAGIALLLGTIAAGTNLPVPLLLLYRAQLELSNAQTAGLFGVYALGLIPAVFVAGQAADRWGRRPMLLVAGVLGLSASVGFSMADGSFGMLLVVRCAQGVAAGTLFAVASAWLQELSTVIGSGARLAAVVMTSGFSVGSLAGGIWGEWLPAPLLIPFLLHALFCGVACLGVSGIRDNRGEVTIAVTGGDSWFLPGMRRRALLVVAPPAIFVFGFPAIAINAVPLLIELPFTPIAFTGVTAALTLGAGAVAAPRQRTWGARTIPRAAVLGGIGLSAIAVVATIPATYPLLLPAVVALGAGGGLALSGGLARLPELANPERAASVTAAFYAVAYLGFALPLAVSVVAPVLSVTVCFAVLAALCLVVRATQGATD